MFIILFIIFGGQGNDSREEWTKFGQDISGQNWVQSSVLSFPIDGQEHDSKKDWIKFCQDIRGQNLVQSSLLSLLTGSQAERIEPNFARTPAGKNWSNPLCCHFLQVSFCVLYLSSFFIIDKPPISEVGLS